MIIEILFEYKEKLKAYPPSMYDTYHGEYSDNELRVNYAYYHYIIWFFVVVILIGMIIMISLNISLPRGYFWSILYGPSV